MTERLLQFIWQFQYFNQSGLQTSQGELLRVIHPGQYNTNQGPDFLDAQIRIGATTWAGSVELHTRTSEWVKHQHQLDKNYDNVILHVVWLHDEKVNELPVLELKDKVSKLLLQQYEDLMNLSSFIPCEKTIITVNELTWKSWKDRLLAERLARKAATIESFLQQNSFHWEETFWWMLARNFGYKVNADAFEAIARSLPTNLFAKHRDQAQYTEALLLGQAGLLNGRFSDAYPKLLQREYRFLKTKYKLRPIHHPVHFLRMRPGNFPTIRLAQLAMLVNNSSHLFSRMKEAHELKNVQQWFDVTASDYWHYHYRFDDESIYKEKRLGESMTDNIVVNTIVPMLFTYGDYYKEQHYKDRAVAWLEQTKSESNAILNGFRLLGIPVKSAFDSQGIIELKTQYCDPKMCLNCGVGNYLLRPSHDRTIP